MHHLGIGHAHARKRVLAIADDTTIVDHRVDALIIRTTRRPGDDQKGSDVGCGELLDE